MMKKIRTPIWLSTILVVAMIILFSLVLNKAQEREMVNQFNRQQMAIAKGVATGLEDLFAGIERSVLIHSRFREPASKHHLQLIYRDLEGKILFIAEGNREGRITASFPASYLKELSQRNDALSHLIGEAGNGGGASSIGDFVLPGGKEKKPSRLIAVVVPQPESGGGPKGFLIVALSLSSIVERYLQPASYILSGDAWVVDNHGNILYHPHDEWVGSQSGILEQSLSGGLSLREKMVKGEEGFGEYDLLKDGKAEKNIVAYVPIILGASTWSVAVSAPYDVAIAQLNKTFFMIMIEASILIAAVLVGAVVMVYSGRKRVRLEEELKYLRERESLQEALAREKSTIEGIIEGSPIPTFVINREHKIIRWNRAFTELSGYEGKDMIGTDKQYLPFYPEKRPVIADLIVDNDIEGLEKYYGKKRVQQSSVVEGAYEADDFYENLGGRKRHLYFLAAPIYDENGEIIAAIETLQDVTREKEMEISLKEYAETLKDELYENIKLRKDIEELYNFLQSIMDSSPDRVFALTSDGIITYVSRELDESTGQHKAVGRHLLELVPPEQRDLVLEEWDKVRKGNYWPFEIEAMGRDGTKRNLLVTPRPIKGTDRYILVQRDITDLKNLEKKFYESQKLAAVGQLSAGIAHEVRNPLSSIKMSLQILEKRLSPTGNDLKRFKIAEKEVEHLEQLVRDILIFAKPVEPDKKPGDINAFLESSLAMAEKAMSEKKIRIQTHYDHGVPPVSFDPAMFKQALLNIYLNAVDAMSEGGTLSISTQSAVQDGRRSVVVRIEDNGSGIDEADIAYLFNPFFTRKNYGTGLGLTQVKKIIDLHQGAVEISSAKGKGTNVVITLPAEEKEAETLQS